MQLEMLESIGRYEIVGHLGAGAMSKVYLAHDPNLDRKLALKVVLQRWSVDRQEQGELERRFLLEARAAGKLSHPGIVRVFDADTDPDTGIPYIAMEWIQGRSLAQLLTDDRPLSGPTTLTMLAQVARALDYAHQFGRIHRDIKPSNILISNDGVAKVSDFGVAKIVSETHTLSGQVLGTPAYMSPEQVRDDQLDGRSDLFSLGAVLYQCVSGTTPFGGESLVQVVYKILNVDPRPLRLPRTEAWVLLREVVDRGLQKDPNARYQSGAQFAEFLEAARDALEHEDEHDFAYCVPNSESEPAATVRFDKSSFGTPASKDPSRPTRTLQLTNTEIRDVVGPRAVLPNSILDTVATTETTAVLTRANRKQRLVTTSLVLMLMTTTAMAAWSWWDRRQSVTEAALKRVAHHTSTLSFAGASSTFHQVQTPAEPPEVEPLVVEVSQEKGIPRPIESKPKPTPSQQVPLLPPSALSRTRVADQRGPKNAVPKEVLTPVTIMYKHRGGDATLQIWLDGVRVWSQQLEAAEGKKQKLLGYESRAVVPVPTGEHALEVRLTDPIRGINAADTIHSRYTNGRKRSMRINLDPGDNVIRLRWKE